MSPFELAELPLWVGTCRPAPEAGHEQPSVNGGLRASKRLC